MRVTNIQAEKRDTSSRSTLNELRKAKRVPGVLYGLDENVHFSALAQDVRKVIYTPHFELVDLEVDGSTQRCIVKDYQLHPVTDELVHVDLLALSPNKPVKVEVPVHFVGQSPGVKAGGTVVQKIRKVRIKTTPENLIEEFSVDISHLELGDSVRIRDIKTQDGVEVLMSAPMPLATIDIPRALKSAATKAANEEAEGAEEGTTEEGAGESTEEGGEG